MPVLDLVVSPNINEAEDEQLPDLIDSQMVPIEDENVKTIVKYTKRKTIKDMNCNLDGDFWSSNNLTRGLPNREVSPKQTNPMQANFFQPEKPDGVVRVEIPLLVDFGCQMKCQKCLEDNYAFKSWGITSHVMEWECPNCQNSLKFESTRLVTPKYPITEGKEGSSPKRVRALPYLEILANRLIPGGGAQTNSRIHAWLGEFGRNETQFHTICNGPVLNCLKAVYNHILEERLPIIIENAKKEFDPVFGTCDGVNKYPKIKVIFDTRWPHRFAWNSLHSTTYVIEWTTKTVLAIIILHRQDSPGQNGTPRNFDGSAPACDPEGIRRGLQVIVEQLHLDPIIGCHDNDAKSKIAMRETKRQLAMSSKNYGKISPYIEEALCTTHGCRHVGREFHQMAEAALSAFKLSSKKNPEKGVLFVRGLGTPLMALAISILF